MKKIESSHRTLRGNSVRLLMNFSARSHHHHHYTEALLALFSARVKVYIVVQGSQNFTAVKHKYLKFQIFKYVCSVGYLVQNHEEAYLLFTFWLVCVVCSLYTLHTLQTIYEYQNMQIGLKVSGLLVRINTASARRIITGRGHCITQAAGRGEPPKSE